MNKELRNAHRIWELTKCRIIVVSESEPAAGDDEENNENDDQPQTPKSRKIGTCPI